MDGLRIASYSILDATHIQLSKTIPASGACFNRTSAFITTMDKAPYFAFSAAWPGPNSCGMAFSVDDDDTLAEVIDS